MNEAIPEPARGGTVPLATVVIACYRHEQFVEQCLDSALAQTVPTKVLLIDDASPDGSRRRVEEYLRRTGADVTTIFNETNLGVCATFNTALRACDTEYVAIIAADDWMLPDRVERLVGRLEDLGPGCGAAYSDFYFVDGDGSTPRATSARAGDPGPEGDLYLTLLDRNVIAAPTVMMRRSVALGVGGYDENLNAEDYDMWLRIAARTRWAYVDAPLVCYRLLDGSLSSDLGAAGFGDTTVATLRKHIGVSAAADALVIPRLEGLVRRRYLAGRSARSTARDLWPLIRRRPSPRAVAYFVAAALGLRGSTVAAVAGRRRRAG